MEGQLRIQNDLYGRISRTYENLRKTGSAKQTRGLVEARLQALEANWAKFDALNDELLTSPLATLADTEYIKQDVPSLAEEAYLLQKGLLLDLIRSLKAKETADSETVGSTAVPATRRTTLPRIQLPQFSGKYEDWPAFRDLFQSLIGKDASTSPVEKLHYLKTSLKGEADLLIRNLLTTGENYDNAWKILSEYYENKRLLTRAYLSNFISLPKMKSESAVELRKIFHGVKTTVSSLDSIGRPVGSCEDLFVFLCVELLDSRSRREWETAISDSTDPPSYVELEQFLDRRLHALEAMLPVKSDSNGSKPSTGSAKSTRSHLARQQESKSEVKRGRCSLCQKEHILMFCEEYKNKTAADRKSWVEGKGLCLNCLGRHKLSECASKKDCTVCSRRHHSSLHDACRENDTAKTSHAVHGTPMPRQAASVLLATARVRVADRYGEWKTVRALVDQGSETSLISERLVQQLRLPRAPASVSVFGVGGLKTGVARSRVAITLTPRAGGSSLSVAALVLPKLTAYTGGLRAVRGAWPHILDLELADPEYSAADQIDVLLGADVYAEILRQGLRRGRSLEPVAQKTALGWILSGPVGETASGHSVVNHQCRLEDDLVDAVRRFWEQEEAPTTARAPSKDELECEEHYARTHSRGADGRYQVRLPLIEPLPDLSETRRRAERVLQHMEGRFARDAEMRTLYGEFMRQYAELGHMTLSLPVAEPSAGRVCYLPHHGVRRDMSSTTKLRVVFNGSAPLRTGESLNQFLRTGPNLLPALTDILSRWRRHRYVIAADIEKMYRQIDVHPQDRDLQRILWRDLPSDKMQEFQLNTVTYGLACAPFLAIRTLRQLADDGGLELPLGAEALRRDVYMDDVLTGAETIQTTREIQQQLVRICRAGGFPLRKWSANDSSLLEDVPAEDLLQQESRWWLPGESHGTLGLRWQPLDDCFSFSVPVALTESFTKRSVLSLAARLFDPLGWLAPTTVQAKIWLQSTWLLGVAWDTPLPEGDKRRWQEFQSELPRLSEVRVPRWLMSGADLANLEVHGFADASERAFAAVVYLRTVRRDGGIEVKLVAAKTKVAPLKQVSLPRLELCAATLLSRLVAHTFSVLELPTAALHLWSDSTVVLGWIRGHPTSWKTYVANRVSEIQTSVPEAQWHHVPGRDNPADCASRGISPVDLVSHPLWWHGPSWLGAEAEPWRAHETEVAADELPEQRVRTHAATGDPKDDIESPLLTRHSRLRRLLRVTAWCRRWLERLRERRTHSTAMTGRTPALVTAALVLEVDELDEARYCWIRAVQVAKFRRELAAIDRGESLPSRSKLTQLNPFRDERGLLRVGGRLRRAAVARDEKHPIILPDDSHFTRLIVEAQHRKTLHGGVQMTLGALRQEYWIPRGRSLVKSCLHRCHTCLRWRAAAPQQLMGELPSARVTPSRPFLHTGVDYAGPVWLRTSKGRGQRASKAFIAVFVCLSSRAVHLDVVSDYTADAFLATLRRFVARRGICQSLYSDCGTNFVGADAQLRSLFAASSRESQRIAACLAEDQIRWHFNPPAAPNFGGIWEAAVKSAKHHLRRVIGEATLTYEEMATLLSQIEACLNSRPLQAMSDDPEDLAALTPGHFLIGSALTAVPEPSLVEEPASRLSRWQLVQQMREHFWTRWTREYLHTLAHRPKWHKSGESLAIGRLCLVRNEATPPNRWPLARIEALHPGADGHVRVVEVRTAASRLTRPVSKLVLLPASTELAVEA